MEQQTGKAWPGELHIVRGLFVPMNCDGVQEATVQSQRQLGHLFILPCIWSEQGVAPCTAGGSHSYYWAQ